MTTLAEEPSDLIDRDKAPLKARRLESIDRLRGLVMILMVLDHTRDFFMTGRVDPTDLNVTTPALFFTRWITHFCAPVFIFLAGTGAYLALKRGKTRAEQSRHLALRGLWLIVLELTVVRTGLLFNLDYRFIPLTVLWAIGWSMIALSALIWLPVRVVGGFGVAMIALHNLLDGVKVQGEGPLRVLWTLLHEQGPLYSAKGRLVFGLYPLIPWIGVMAAGYAFGAYLTARPGMRRARCLALGLAITAMFFIMRGINDYGEPRPWKVQPRALFTAMSFVNASKYPPSLIYLLMTLGPAIALLPLLERPLGAAGRVLTTIGRVPLFYYLMQWYVIHGLAVLVIALRGKSITPFFASVPFNLPEDYGYNLPWTYLAWAASVALLYPLCRWFGALKRRRPDGWLTYF